MGIFLQFLIKILTKIRFFILFVLNFYIFQLKLEYFKIIIGLFVLNFQLFEKVINEKKNWPCNKLR